MLNGILTITEPDKPLNDADHVGSFYYITKMYFVFDLYICYNILINNVVKACAK